MEPSTRSSTAYAAHDIQLSEPHSARWDGGTPDDRRRLIAEVIDSILIEASDVTACAIRLLHADGRLLAKTVLHKPLFANVL